MAAKTSQGSYHDTNNFSSKISRTVFVGILSAPGSTKHGTWMQVANHGRMAFLEEFVLVQQEALLSAWQHGCLQVTGCGVETAPSQRF